MASLNKSSAKFLAALAACILAVSHVSAAQGIRSSAPPSWPRVFDRNGAHVIVYQPQLKAWQRYRLLLADTAISITDSGKTPVLGVVSWRAETFTNVSAKTVYISNIQVLDARFPSLGAAQAAVMQQRIHQVYPTMTMTIGLPRMIASLEHLNEPVHSVAASTDAPKILISTTPAIVLLVDGKPVLAPIPSSTLQYVVNTNWDLIHDQSGYYLLDGKIWLESKELAGPWVATRKIPAEIAKLPPKQNWDEVLKAVPPAASAAPAPQVLFTKSPQSCWHSKGNRHMRKSPAPT